MLQHTDQPPNMNLLRIIITSEVIKSLRIGSLGWFKKDSYLSPEMPISIEYSVRVIPTTHCSTHMHLLTLTALMAFSLSGVDAQGSVGTICGPSPSTSAQIVFL